MRKINSIAIIIITIIICNSCKTQEDQINEFLNLEILPLNVGNHWLYSAVGYDTNGNKSIEDTISIFVIKDTLIFGEKFFLLENHFQELNYVINKKNGLYNILYDRHYDSLYPQILAFKYPANVGDFYLCGCGKDTIWVNSLNKNIKTKAGTFKCIEYYEHNGHFIDQFYYYTPGIGLIKQEIWISMYTPKYLAGVYELLYYKLN